MKKRLWVILICLMPLSAAFGQDAQDAGMSGQAIVMDIASGKDRVVGEGVAYDGDPELSSQQERWGSGPDKTHQWVLARAIYLLDKRYGEPVSRVLFTHASTLLAYSDMPDKDEVEHLFSGHFWDPDKNKSIFGITYNTAYMKFRSHAQNAVTFYKMDRQKAIQELGRSIHFLEDLSCTYHSANMDALSRPSHGLYEKWVDRHKQDYAIEWPDKVGQYPGTFDHYTSEACYGAARHSKQFTYCVGLKTDKYPTMAAPCLAYAQNDIAAYLYRFLEEVREVPAKGE